MLCLGPKKSLSSPRLKLTAQGMAQCTNNQSQMWHHSAIQAPQAVWRRYITMYLAIQNVIEARKNDVLKWIWLFNSNVGDENMWADVKIKVANFFTKGCP